MIGPTERARDRTNRASWLVVTAVVALALNLRPVVNSMASLLPEIRADLGLSATVGGALQSLPPLCFAIFGLLAPTLSSRLGAERVILAGLALMAAGQAVRVLDGVGALFVGSVLALAGLAVCNVLMPSVIRRYFPERIPAMTALYTVCLMVGAAVSSAVSVPTERALDADWTVGMGMWSMLTVVALIPWMVLSLGRPGDSSSHVARPLTVRMLVRSPVARVLTYYFGLTAAQAYVINAWLAQIMVDAGSDLQQGGYAIGVSAALGVVTASTVPVLMRSENRLRWAFIAIAALYVLGYLGLLLFPEGAVWSWAVLLGIATGSFPMILALLALRARTPQGAASLSAFAQSIGYLFAASGPILIGALHDLADGWTVPLIAMMLSAALMGMIGWQAARPAFVEDNLAARCR